MTRRVPRTRVDLGTGLALKRVDTVAVEEPLEIRLDGVSVATTMRTPGDDFDYALGHLLTEGVISAADDIATMMHCTDEDASGRPTFNVVDATSRAGAPPMRAPRARTEAMTSACGVCGSETIADTLTRSPYAVHDDPLHLTPERVGTALASLRSGQRTFERTGGVHAAALLRPDGEVVAVREDVGRHNAVDKVIGAAARLGHLPLTGHILVVSARASFEIVQKASMSGIPAIVAVSAPTSLAVDLATDAGITLVAFARPPTFSVYARADRVGHP